MSDFADEDLRGLLDGDVDFMALNKIAIDYADAVIQITEDVNPELVQYAKESGKAFLGYVEEDERKEAYMDFYRSLTEEEED